MPEIAVAYHADGFRPARPAVNVKCYGAGLDYWPDAFVRTFPGTATFPATHHRADDRYAPLVERATDAVFARFWSDAREMAATLGLGPIEQEGRSGGWLVLTDGRDPEDPATFDVGGLDPDDDDVVEQAGAVREWLANYRYLAEWCADQVRQAPDRVAALAQQLAMDELGAEPARRMWATFRRELTLAEYRATDAATFYAGGM